jgi:hypothetical protein
MGEETDVSEDERQAAAMARSAKEELAQLNKELDILLSRKKDLETFLRVADSLEDIGAP